VVSDTVFYDGTCGFCHWSVKLLLAADRRGTLFRYAPLGGDTFGKRIPEAGRIRLPDSLVVHTAAGAVLVRSAAVLHILRRVGGWWRLVACFLGCLPRPLLDRLYDALAAVRHRLFRRPSQSCPVIPLALRRRFDP
jgi:predicted DCC family thiol-disulfide oxidoreductase YuxK